MYVEQEDLLFYIVHSKAQDKSMRSRAKAILKKIEMEYYGKFDGDVVLDMAEVLPVLTSVLSRLPKSQDSADVLENPSLLYRQIVNCINNGTIMYYSTNDRTSYYGLFEEQIDALAKHFGMKRLPFLKKLDEYNLLYLTASSQGYQTKVRIPAVGGMQSKVEWRYCIYKIEYFTQKRQLEKPKNP